MEKSRSYSGLFIITPDKEGEIDEITGGIGSVITENSGSIVKENMIGKKTLSYPIQKKAEAIYYEVTFTALPESVTSLNESTTLPALVLEENFSPFPVLSCHRFLILPPLPGRKLWMPAAQSAKVF